MTDEDFTVPFSMSNFMTHYRILYETPKNNTEELCKEKYTFLEQCTTNCPFDKQNVYAFLMHLKKWHKFNSKNRKDELEFWNEQIISYENNIVTDQNFSLIAELRNKAEKNWRYQTSQSLDLQHIFHYNISDDFAISFNTQEKNFYLHQVITNQDGSHTLKPKTFLAQIDIEFLAVYEYHNELVVNYSLDDNEYLETIDDIKRKFHIQYSLSSTETKYIRIFLANYLKDYITKNGKLAFHDPIYVENDIIHTEFDEHIYELDTKEILETFNDVYKHTSNKKALAISLSYNVVSLMAMLFREKGKIFPLLAAMGKSQAGKTSTQELFLVRGCNQELEKTTYNFNQVKSIFMFSLKLNESTYPCIFDDSSTAFFEKYGSELKGMAKSTIIQERGMSNQTSKTYHFRRNGVFTINESLNLELAELFRIIILDYDSNHKDQQNRELWWEAVNKLPPGFLLKIFIDLFDNSSINELFTEIEAIKLSEEYNQKLITVCKDKIIALYERYNIPILFNLDDFNIDIIKANNDEKQFLIEMLNQWSYLNDDDKKVRSYMSKITLDIEENNDSFTIWITATGFQYYLKYNKCPYWKILHDYVNNSTLIPRPQEDINHRFSGQPRRATKIIINKLEWLGETGKINSINPSTIDTLKNQDNPLLTKILGFFNMYPKECFLLDDIYKKFDSYKEKNIEEIVLQLLKNGQIYEPDPEKGFKKC